MNRTIISKQMPHRGGTARLEQDGGGHQYLVCTGCGVDQFVPGVAPGLAALVQHTSSNQS